VLVHYAESYNITELKMCVQGYTDLKINLERMQPYLYPFDMEFRLLAVGMLFTMLFKAKQGNAIS